jgi:hypothetical protein
MTSKKAIAFLTGLILVLSVSATALAADELYGAWRLVSYKRTLVTTGETTDVFGKSPKGSITFGRDGRALALVTSDKRPNVPDAAKMTDQERAELYKTMIAWAGTYTFDEKTIKIRVDVSWNESWNGTEQMRHVKFEGKRMIMSTEPALGALDGKLRTSVFTWEKVQ